MITSNTTSHIGRPVSRVDGRTKVTGAAKYAGEFQSAGLAYGYVISSDVARGRIKKIDASDALAVPGVIGLVSHENRPHMAWGHRGYRDEVAPPGSPFRPLFDGKVLFSAQPVALVVAESFELARYAASLVRVEYQAEPHATDLEAQRGTAYVPHERDGMAPPSPRGDADGALAAAEVRHDAEYRVPVEHHNPMECYATTVEWHGDGKLMVYDKTQGVQNVFGYLSRIFGYSSENLRVVSPFVGGAFGSGLRPQYQVVLAVLAARQFERSVRVTLSREQMFSLGYRPATWQRVALGAAADGRLSAIVHEVLAETSRYEDYSETVSTWSALLYQCENVHCAHQVVPLDVCTPCDMRAPGAVWGMYALECAMDELSYQLQLDPIELRLRNSSKRDQITDLPYSSKELRACYRQGAERFGWSRRDPAPRSMNVDGMLIGMGMASGIWESMQMKAAAKVVLSADGKLSASSATADIGTGTYTVMTQIAAEALGLSLDAVTFELGDSSLPPAPVEGGSFTVSTVGSALKAACDHLRKQLFDVARRLPDSPLAKAKSGETEFVDGQLRMQSDPSRGLALVEIMRQAGLDRLEGTGSAKPGAARSKHSCYAHSAVFAEVRVDEELGTIVVSRVVSAVAGGRIINPKTAGSQILGGIVWGLGMALEEETVMDHDLGRFINHNLADYHVPVHADIHALEVVFVEEHDEVVNPLGAKGLGELGLVGVAPAIANAVFHATGKRIRELPITLDKLL